MNVKQIGVVGLRRKLFSNGHPGYLRAGSVHRLELDVIKGMHLINAVDEKSLQLQVVRALVLYNVCQRVCDTQPHNR